MKTKIKLKFKDGKKIQRTFYTINEWVLFLDGYTLSQIHGEVVGINKRGLKNLHALVDIIQDLEKGV